MRSLSIFPLAACAFAVLPPLGFAQEPLSSPTDVIIPAGGRGGPNGPGWPMRIEVKLVEKFDEDGDGRLGLEERKAAREVLAKERTQGGGLERGGRPPFGPRENEKPGEPGGSLFEFENADWERELADFHGTGVEVPATLKVDGKTFKDVGVDMRGASPFMMIEEGCKRSFGVSLDFAHATQKLGGYCALHLLN